METSPCLYNHFEKAMFKKLSLQNLKFFETMCQDAINSQADKKNVKFSTLKKLIIDCNVFYENEICFVYDSTDVSKNNETIRQHK